jgi:hypothetical protein
MANPVSSPLLERQQALAQQIISPEQSDTLLEFGPAYATLVEPYDPPVSVKRDLGSLQKHIKHEYKTWGDKSSDNPYGNTYAHLPNVRVILAEHSPDFFPKASQRPENAAILDPSPRFKGEDITKISGEAFQFKNGDLTKRHEWTLGLQPADNEPPPVYRVSAEDENSNTPV